MRLSELTRRLQQVSAFKEKKVDACVIKGPDFSVTLLEKGKLLVTWLIWSEDRRSYQVHREEY